MLLRKDLTPEEYDGHYEQYLSLVSPDAGLDQVLQDSLQQSIGFIEALERPLDYAYAPNKWTIGQVIMHNIDTERVFAYRAFRFLRGDQSPLAGFDQDVFAQAFSDSAFAKANLIEALKATRAATQSLFVGIPEEQLKQTGVASGRVMSARVIPFLIAGHHKHHENVILERY